MEMELKLGLLKSVRAHERLALKLDWLLIWCIGLQLFTLLSPRVCRRDGGSAIRGRLAGKLSQ